jgi:hypothetical protein
MTLNDVGSFVDPGLYSGDSAGDDDDVVLYNIRISRDYVISHLIINERLKFTRLLLLLLYYY